MPEPDQRCVRRLLTRALVLMVLVGAVIAAGGTSPAAAAPRHVVADTGCGLGALRATAGSTGHTTVVDGVSRTYRVHVPSGYTGLSSYPLIVAYHGHAERSTSFETYTRLSSLPAIVVYPDGLRGTDNKVSWQGAPYSSPRSDDIAFTRAILREVRASTCVDSHRIYAVGRSNGGGMVSVLACRTPGEFAAFGIVSGAFYQQTMSGCGAAPAASIIDFHGTADGVIHYDGGVRFGERYWSVPDWLHMWAAKAGCGTTPVTVPVNVFVDRLDWPWCSGLRGGEITHYRIRGGTHRWPGSTGNRAAGQVSDSISATSLIWQFFQTHTS